MFYHFFDHYHYFDRLKAGFVTYDDNDTEISHLIYFLHNVPRGLDFMIKLVISFRAKSEMNFLFKNHCSFVNVHFL